MAQKGNEEIVDLFQNLKLAEKSAISLKKVESDYVLDMAVQNSSAGADTLLAATSSDHGIRLFKKSTLASSGSAKGHNNVVSGVKFGNMEPQLLYSSSWDGVVHCWDTRSSMAKPCQTFAQMEGSRLSLSSFDINCSDRILCAGSEAVPKGDTYILFWDRRKNKLMGGYNESHSDDVTQVCFHPEDANRLATGGADGLVCVFDLSQKSEDDALLSTLNANSTVSRVGWQGQSRENVYCFTRIDTYHVWDALEGDCLTEKLDIKEKVQGSDSVDFLMDCIQTSDSKAPVILGGTYSSGAVRVLALGETEVQLRCSLTGGHTESVRCFHWDPQTEMLVTGGEDALLCLWTLSASTDSATGSATKQTGKLKVKRSAHKKIQPY